MNSGRRVADRRARTAKAAADSVLPLEATRRPAQHRVHDLQAMCVRLCRAYFTGDVRVQVRWGRGTCGRWSMTFGSYDFESRVIRLHPRLDRHDVPGFFVEAVLYHELLHHVLGYERRRGRRVVHSRRFRQLEAGFEHAHLARSWQRENLPRLLGRAPRPARRVASWPIPLQTPTLF